MANSSHRTRLPRWFLTFSLRRPRLVLTLWIIVLAIAGFGVLRLQIDTSTDSVLNRSDADWSFYQRSLKLFGGDEVVVAAFPVDTPLDPDALRKVTQFSRDVSAIDGVRRVDSLSTVPLIEAMPDGGLSLAPALRSQGRNDQRQYDGLADRLSRDRIAPGLLTSHDGKLLAVNALIDDKISGRFEQVVGQIRAALPPGQAWVSGVPVFRTEINIRTGAEIGFFVGFTVLATSAYLLATFRSLRAVIIPLAAGGLGTWALLGAMGFSQVPITLTTMILPSLMLALGCANVMHVITAAVGASGSTELRRAIDPVVLPVMLSGLTTTIGFLAVSGVNIDAIRAVGTYGALGVLTILSATLTAVPAALMLWPLPSKPVLFSHWIRQRVCSGLALLASRNRNLLLASWLVVTCVFGLGVARLTIETDATRWFTKASTVRMSYEEIKRGLSGISPMNVVIESNGGGPVTAPDALAAIARFTDYLQSLPDVGRALSIADPLRQMHGGFMGSSQYPVPSSRDLTEQYLVLLESVDQIDDLITEDRLAANVVLRVDNNGSDDLRQVARDAENWWEEHGARGYSARATGIMYEFARAQDEIAVGQLKGLAFALITIGVVLVFVFRQIELASITLVGNATPVFLAFGAMGLAGVPLDAGTVLVGNLAFGIAVDETLHLVGGFQERSAEGERGYDALRGALEMALPSILYTTAAVALGFGVFGFSQFAFTRNLGLLTVGVMALCALANALLLPALLLTGHRNRPTSIREPNR